VISGSIKIIVSKQPAKPNRRYKDSMFTLLFNTPDEARRLYNALTGSAYGPDTPVHINTIKDVFYRTQKNDLSFVLDDKLVNIIEHQSSINPNMPLRLFLYAAQVYETLIEHKALYGGKVLIPRTELLVLYNGLEAMPDFLEQRLSESFKPAAGHNRIDLEVVVQIYNINHGRNREILERSESLGGYALFVAKVREYLGVVRGLSAAGRRRALREAIKKAIEYCIKHNILREFMVQHGGEVINVLTAEFDITVAEKIWKEEARMEGELKGRTERDAEILALMNKVESLEDFSRLREKLKATVNATRSVQS
jgi:hypothetical protein